MGLSLSRERLYCLSDIAEHPIRGGGFLACSVREHQPVCHFSVAVPCATPFPLGGMQPLTLLTKNITRKVAR
jgi:hypothetical protein